MKLFNYLAAIVLCLAVFSCRHPSKDYKLTPQQSKRIHNDYVYRRNKIDKERDAEKVERKEKEAERLAHNLKVANSRNPIKKMAVKKTNKPFNHH